MRLNYIIISVIGCLFIFSCTDEPNINEYSVSIKNESLNFLSIEAYLQGALISNIDLDDNESGLFCQYTNENFTGYKLTSCGIDSLVFKFLNNKGYITTINTQSMIDFPNDENPFGASEKFELNEGNYEFIITQEDFENAFDLPE